jgi:hypothetical protein
LFLPSLYFFDELMCVFMSKNFLNQNKTVSEGSSDGVNESLCQVSKEKEEDKGVAKRDTLGETWGS